MKKLVIGFICLVLLFGCGSKGPTVEKKEKDAYNPQETLKVFERAGYKLEYDYGEHVDNITLFKTLNDPSFTASINDDTLYSITYFDYDDGASYVFNPNDESKDNAILGLMESNRKSCHFDVVKQKELIDDKTGEETCDTLDKEDSNALYEQVYKMLYDLNISRNELIQLFKWKLEDQ